MARETTKWPSTRWPITKIMSSDGCNGNRVPLEMGPWYDFREFGCHLGNVGLMGFCLCEVRLHRFEVVLVPTGLVIRLPFRHSAVRQCHLRAASNCL